MVQSGDLLHQVADTFMSILHILLELSFLVMIAESFCATSGKVMTDLVKARRS